MRRPLVLAALATVLSGCPKLPPETPIAAVEMTYTIESKEAYSRVLRAVVDADLSVEMKDADAGIVQTEWHLSGRQSAFGGQLERRVRFKIVTAEGACRVKPQVDRRGIDTLGPKPVAHAWEEQKGLTDVEKAVFDTLVQKIDASLKK